MGNQNGLMTKAETMDNLIASNEKGVSSTEILNIVYRVFKLDLDASTLDLPVLPRAAIDAYLEHGGNEVTGAEIRKMINQTFAINLDALSALEGAQFSLYSKGHWMVQHQKDLFVVHTGTGDIDARIFPTNYFTEQTGSENCPLN